MRWPEPYQVLQAVLDWSVKQAERFTSLHKVGVFGSYGCADSGVGSDLDLLILDQQAMGPQFERLPAWPLETLPLSCDALVLTLQEIEKLLASQQRLAAELRRALRWIWSKPQYTKHHT
jgi:hypothetical protein